jgi:hypothetical protein
MTIIIRAGIEKPNLSLFRKSQNHLSKLLDNGRELLQVVDPSLCKSKKVGTRRRLM